jgi:hypothetical protein
VPFGPCTLLCVQGKRFQLVDATWRATMRRALEDPKALHAMRQPGLLTRLTEANVLLDLIQKGLNAYVPPPSHASPQSPLVQAPMILHPFFVECVAFRRQTDSQQLHKVNVDLGVVE